MLIFTIDLFPRALVGIVAFDYVGGRFARVLSGEQIKSKDLLWIGTHHEISMIIVYGSGGRSPFGVTDFVDAVDIIFI
jgi:hypothetical protein